MIREYAIKGLLYSSVSLASLFSVSGPVENFKNYLGDKYTQTKFQIVNKLATANGYIPNIPEKTWTDLAEQYAQAEGINPCVIKAVIKIESNNCTQLISSAGAMGCMQLMRNTAKIYGVTTDAARLDPEQNIYAGTKHLSKLIRKHGLFLALKIYNAGEARVDMTPENREFPHKVLSALASCIG